MIFFFDIDHDRHKVVFYAIYVEHGMAVIEKKGLCVSIDFYSIQGLKGCTKRMRTGGGGSVFLRGSKAMMQYVCNVILSPHIAILEDSCEMTKNL